MLRRVKPPKLGMGRATGEDQGGSTTGSRKLKSANVAVAKPGKALRVESARAASGKRVSSMVAARKRRDKVGGKIVGDGATDPRDAHEKIGVVGSATCCTLRWLRAIESPRVQKKKNYWQWYSVRTEGGRNFLKP